MKWISVLESKPDVDSQRRVCAYTPTDNVILRFRFVSSDMFRLVCSEATHWFYIEDPDESLTQSLQGMYNNLTQKQEHLGSDIEKVIYSNLERWYATRLLPGSDKKQQFNGWIKALEGKL